VTGWIFTRGDGLQLPQAEAQDEAAARSRVNEETRNQTRRPT